MNSQPSGFKKLLNTKTVRVLFITLVCGLFAAILSGASIARYEIIIHDEDTTTVVFTSKADPYEVLLDEGITLEKNDTIEWSGFGEDQTATLDVIRGKLVSIEADGKSDSFFMTTGTVADALNKGGITLGEEDKINLPLEEKVTDGIKIIINRVTYEEVEYTKAIPFSVTETRTRNLANGKRSTIKEGADGIHTTYAKQTLIDGVVVEEEVVKEAITKYPVNAQVLVGDSKAPVSQLTPATPIELDANGNPVNYKYKVTGKATAYSALGRKTSLKPGCVAMDLSKFPRGTKLYIKTASGSYVYGYSEVRDTGAFVHHGTVLVDLFFDTYRESCLFGAKVVDVYVLS